MFKTPQMLALILLSIPSTWLAFASAQEAGGTAVETSPSQPSESVDTTQPADRVKPKEGNAGQDDLDAAIDLKVGANNIEKSSKIIELIEKAIEKGLPSQDISLAKELLASSALERAKLQLQEMIKGRYSNDTMLRRVQRLVLSDLELAIKNDATLGEAYLLTAKLTVGTDANKAKASLDKAIEQLGHEREKRGEAYALRSLLQKEDADKLDDIKQALKDLPSSVEVQRRMFALLIDKEKFEELLQAGKSLLHEDKKNPVAIQATITALLKLDRQDEAVELLDGLIQSDDSDLDLRTIRANLYLILSKNDEALADATKLIELKSDSAEGYVIRSKAYLQLAQALKKDDHTEELTNARRDIESALELKPNSVEGIRLRALVSSAQKRYDEAIQDVTLLARNDPQEPVWLLQLATLYQLNEQPTMASKAADQLIAIDKSNGQAYRIRGDAKLSVGDQTAATSDYQKALEFMKEKNEERSGLLNNLAWILATSTEDNLRDGKKAIALGLEACEITEYNAAHILSTLAAAYAETGDFDEAIKWSKKAVKLGAHEEHAQLDQLEKELKSYEEKKPWREKQDVKENKPPLIKPENTIET